MSRLSRRALLLLPVLAAAVTACNDASSSIPIGPSEPPTVLTETFSGTLNHNSAYTHSFAVSDAGDVTVFLLMSSDVSNADNNAIPLGVSLGTWNGATCAIVITSENMTPTSNASTDPPPVTNLTGRATSAGNLCVRVFDVGFVSGAASYELLIDHY